MARALEERQEGLPDLSGAHGRSLDVASDPAAAPIARTGARWATAPRARLLNCSGTKVDPRLVAAPLRVLDRRGASGSAGREL